MANTRNKRVNGNKREISPKVEKRRDEGKEKFLVQLEEMPIIQVAAAHTGIHRSTYYRWHEDDSDFRERADSAIERGNSFMNDMMESILVKKAKEGNMTAVIFWLKFHSKTYIDIRRYDHFHEFKDNPLTEEKKKQIAEAMMAWSHCSKCDGEDERDSDYESNGGEPEKKKEKVEDTKIEEVERKIIPQNKKTASYYNPKQC